MAERTSIPTYRLIVGSLDRGTVGYVSGCQIIFADHLADQAKQFGCLIAAESEERPSVENAVKRNGQFAAVLADRIAAIVREPKSVWRWTNRSIGAARILGAGVVNQVKQFLSRKFRKVNQDTASSVSNGRKTPEA